MAIIWPVFVLFEITKHHPPAHLAFLANKHYRKQYNIDFSQYAIITFQNSKYMLDMEGNLGMEDAITILPEQIVPTFMFTCVHHFHLFDGNTSISVYRDEYDKCKSPVIKKGFCSREGVNRLETLYQLLVSNGGVLPAFHELIPYIELWKEIKNTSISRVNTIH